MMRFAWLSSRSSIGECKKRWSTVAHLWTRRKSHVDPTIHLSQSTLDEVTESAGELTYRAIEGCVHFNGGSAAGI